jgi:hypothetical protein
MAHHDDHPGHRELDQRVENVEHHGPAAEPVEGLGAGRPHTGPLTGGQYDHRQLPPREAAAATPIPGVPILVVPVARG